MFIARRHQAGPSKLRRSEMCRGQNSDRHIPLLQSFCFLERRRSYKHHAPTERTSMTCKFHCVFQLNCRVLTIVGDSPHQRRDLALRGALLTN